jgi:hypothetical protein
VWTQKSGKIKKKITYHYYEVPKYYGIIAGINGGTPLGNGYYMVDGQGIGNLFDRSYNEIFTKSKSGWSFLGVLLINLVLGSLVPGFGLIATINIAMATIQNILGGTNFFGQPWILPTGGNKGSANVVGVDPTPRLNKSPVFAKDEYLSNDGHVIGGDGASHITWRVSSGNEYNQTLRGFNEPARERDAYQYWNKAPGGFIQLPSQ